MVAPRELSLIMFCHVEEDGAILITIYNNDADGFEANSSNVHAKLPIGGAHIIPHATDPNKCTFRKILEIDLGGYIPSFICKQVVSDQSNGLILLNKCMKSWLDRVKDRLNEPLIE